MVADSTAQSETPLESVVEEENVVIEEEPSKEGGDNMSLSELTSKLLAKNEEREGGEESETDEPEVVDETVFEEEPDQQEENRKIEQPGLVAQTDDGEEDKRKLLDRYGLDLDALSEDEAMSLGRALRTESLKRFGRLTAQKREAESALRDLETKVANDDRPQPRPVENEKDPMSDVWTEETLAKKEQDLQAIEDWAEDALQSEAQYDEEGEEFLIETDGRKYTKRDLLGIRSNARKMLRRGGALENRRQFLAQRQQFDGDALKYFPWMSDEQSSEFMEYQQFVTQEKYKDLLDSIPEANVFAGLVVEGNLRVKERLNGATNGNSPTQLKEKPIIPATAAAAAPKRVPMGDTARIRKAVDQAQRTFEKTGSIQSLARLRELQAKMS